tara:strand:+ start:779 stop:925 length:147 start_codon:yes stop_codon:yes gene_type:complete
MTNKKYKLLAMRNLLSSKQIPLTMFSDDDLKTLKTLINTEQKNRKENN